MSAAASSSNSNPGEDRLLAYRVGRLEEAHKEAVAEIRDAVKSIDNSLKVLAVIQEQHGATRESLLHTTKLLHALTERLSGVEREMPTLTLARKWVLAAMTGGGAAAGAGVLALVMK